MRQCAPKSENVEKGFLRGRRSFGSVFLQGGEPCRHYPFRIVTSLRELRRFDLIFGKQFNSPAFNEQFVNS